MSYVARVTFDVVILFVVVCGCGPIINLSCKPSYSMHDVLVCMGVFEGLGVSSGCLGNL